MREPARIPPPPPAFDLRTFCRNSDKVFCNVEFDTFGGLRPWLQLGSVTFRVGQDTQTLAARLKGATDIEHDTPYVISMDVIGLTLINVSDHTFLYRAWVGHDPENFRVPDASYNPFAHPQVKACKECKGEDSHLIVPDGYYLPEPNIDVWNRVKHWPLSIRIGTLGL